VTFQSNNDLCQHFTVNPYFSFFTFYFSVIAHN